jgi:hypothetical protein
VNKPLTYKDQRFVGSRINASLQLFSTARDRINDTVNLKLLLKIIQLITGKKDVQEIDMFTYLPDELVSIVVSYLSPRDYKNLSEVNRRFRNFLIGELYKDGYQRLYNKLVELLFKDRVVSIELESLLVSLYLLTEGKDAINNCTVIEMGKEDEILTGIKFFLRYYKEPFKNWLDLHQITILEYNETSQEPIQSVSVELERLINIVNTLGITLDKPNLDYQELSRQVDSGINLEKFISYKINQPFNLRSAYSACIARMVLAEYEKRKITLNRISLLSYIRKEADLRNNPNNYRHQEVFFENMKSKVKPNFHSVLGFFILLLLAIKLTYEIN